MAEILSFFTIKAGLCVVSVLMLGVSILKVADFFEGPAEQKVFSLKMNKTWMTVLSRVFFYLGLIIIALTSVKITYDMGVVAPFWVYVMIFSIYAFIGYVIQLILVVIEVVLVVLVLAGYSEACSGWNAIIHGREEDYEEIS